MGRTNKSEPVRCWEEQVVIPTYPVHDADPNPMFLETRVYQGSNLLLFDDDLDERKRVESRFLGALADHGLGHTDKATGELREVIAADPNHLFAISVLEWIEQEGKLAGIEPEVRPAS
jgi:hypothetical protein